MTDTSEQPVVPSADAQEPTAPARSQWRDVWDQFRKHKGALFGGGFLLLELLTMFDRLFERRTSCTLRRLKE